MGPYNGWFLAVSGLPTPLDDMFDVVSVSMLVAGEPLGVTVDGLKLQTEATSTLQIKLTVWLNPFSGVTVRVTVPV